MPWPALRRSRLGAAAWGLADDVGTRAYTDLGQDVRDMGLDGVAGQEQLSGDVRVGQALHDQVGDVLLRRCERRPAGGRAFPVGTVGPDTVRPQALFGPADVPPRAERGILAGRVRNPLPGQA